MKAPTIYVVVHVGYGSWTLHGYYFDKHEAQIHCEKLNAGTSPSIEHHIEDVDPGDGEKVVEERLW